MGIGEENDNEAGTGEKSEPVMPRTLLSSLSSSASSGMEAEARSGAPLTPAPPSSLLLLVVVVVPKDAKAAGATQGGKGAEGVSSKVAGERSESEESGSVGWQVLKTAISPKFRSFPPIR